MKYLFMLLVVFGACSIETGQKEQDIHSWSTHHWKNDEFPLKYENITKNPQWDSAIKNSLCLWNHLDTTVKIEETSSAGAKVAIEQRRSNRWLGLAQIYLSEGHIIKGKVTMNPILLESSEYSPEAAQHVFCQELGHVYGLDHIVGNTCMNDCAGTANKEEWLACLNDPANVGPNVHDEEQLNAIYSHDDSAPDAGVVDASIPDAGFDEPLPPGCGKGKRPKCTQGWVTVHTWSMW